MTKPKRCFEVTLKIGADDWEGVLHQINFLEMHLTSHGPECKSIMGGPSDNHIVTVEHSPNMTHDIYHEDLKEYLAHIKKRDKEAAADMARDMAGE